MYFEEILICPRRNLDPFGRINGYVFYLFVLGYTYEHTILL